MYLNSSFSVEADLLTEDQILLICEGLDTLTDIYINDHLIAATDNMHRTWKFPVKEYLKEAKTRFVSYFTLFSSILKTILMQNTRKYIMCPAVE